MKGKNLQTAALGGTVPSERLLFLRQLLAFPFQIPIQFWFYFVFDLQQQQTTAALCQLSETGWSIQKGRSVHSPSSSLRKYELPTHLWIKGHYAEKALCKNQSTFCKIPNLPHTVKNFQQLEILLWVTQTMLQTSHPLAAFSEQGSHQLCILCTVPPSDKKELLLASEMYFDAFWKYEF